MNKQTAILRSFLENEKNFIVKLRFLDGLDKDGVDVLMNILDDIHVEIKDQKMIEKELAFLLIEIVPILMSMPSMYPEEEQEGILKAIGKISMKISEVLEC